jgi:hypothetical protein
MAKMSDKTKRAINAGRRRAGLKPIKFGSKKKTTTKYNKSGKMVSFGNPRKRMATGKIKKSGIGNW